MNPEQIQKIIDLFAEKLGPMAEVVWGAYLRQAYISAIQDTLTGVVLLILGLVAARIGLKSRAKLEEKLSEDKYAKTDSEQFDVVVSWVVAAFLLFIAVWILSVAPFRLLNLEYNAINLLLRTVK